VQVLSASSVTGNVSGFTQITILIPADLTSLGNVPLVIQFGDASSQQGITIAIAAPPPPIPPLLPPSHLQAVAIGSMQISLTWDNSNTNATGFQVERKSGTSGQYALLAIVSNTTNYLDNTAAPNTTYTYRMRSHRKEQRAFPTTPMKRVQPPQRHRRQC
jgi:hypothetical protein